MMMDSCMDFIKCEIFRKNNRTREVPIKTLFDEHSLSIEINRRRFSLTRYRENIARNGDIYLGWVNSSYRCNDDDRIWTIENIDSNLSDIHIMIHIIANLDIDMSVVMMLFMRYMCRCRMCVLCIFFWRYSKYFEHGWEKKLPSSYLEKWFLQVFTQVLEEDFKKLSNPAL